MKIYIVTHEHNAEDLESCPNNIVSAHLSREKAEASLAREKKNVSKNTGKAIGMTAMLLLTMTFVGCLRFTTTIVVTETKY